MKRRAKPQQRQRMKREPRLHRDRTQPARVFRVKPDPALPFVVEVRVARNRRAMRWAINFHEGQRAADGIELECMGFVRSWWGRRTRRQGIVRARQIVARMFLNVPDLRKRPSEIVAHESTHAAMAWARFRGANLDVMPGEEVACYAAGQLVRQINHHLYAMRVW